MTILVGLKDYKNQRVVLASDGLVTGNNGSIGSRKYRKWRRFGDVVIGVAGHFTIHMILDREYETLFPQNVTAISFSEQLQKEIKSLRIIIQEEQDDPIGFDIGYVELKTGKFFHIDSYHDVLEQDFLCLGMADAATVLTSFLLGSNYLNVEDVARTVVKQCCIHNVFCGGELFLDSYSADVSQSNISNLFSQ
jgi:ATP-dependent protease HslVU (ClpYQ) peptidase subunit